MPYPTHARKRHYALLSWSPVALLIATCLVLTGCDEPVRETPPQRQVRTWVATQQHLPATTWTGTIEPAEEVTLQFRLDGRLATRPVDVGSRVTKDQVVATLTGSQSKEDMAAILAEYQEALAAEHNGRLALARVQKLYTIGTASRAQLEEARASMATLSARKIRAQAQKSGALNESAFSALTSPFAGVVTRYFPSPGQNIAAGQDIVKIASDTAEVEFSVPAQMSARLHPGDAVSVNTDGVWSEARVRYVSPQLDNVTRTSLVRARLDSSDAGPVFGRAVTIGLKTSGKLYFPVPASSLTRSGNHPAVFVVNPQTGKLEFRQIVIDRYTSDDVWVSRGLAPGEHVVTAGTSTLESGEKVALTAGESK